MDMVRQRTVEGEVGDSISMLAQGGCGMVIDQMFHLTIDREHVMCLDTLCQNVV